MLNQSKSNIKNAWKYFVIFPALALFLMSFNVETVEVVKESEPTDFTTSSEFSFTVEDSFIPNEDEPKTISKARTFTNKVVKPDVSIFQKIIEAKITKNTTDAQLKEIKESLKKDGIEFSYKNVKRNAQNEITGIQVTYKDSDGNTGNYALSSESPINTFHFFKNENGSVGFKSENINSEQRMKWVEAREMDKEKREEIIKERKKFMEEHKEEMMKEREHMMQEKMKMMEEHEAMSDERRKEIEIRIKEAKEKHEKERDEYQKQREYIIKERIKINDSLKDKHGNIFIHEDEHKMLFPGSGKALIIVDGDEVDEHTIEIMSPENIAHINVLKGEKALEIYGDKGKDGVIIIKTKPHNKNSFIYDVEHDIHEPNVEVIVDPKSKMKWVSAGHGFGINIIKQSTTDAELKRMKAELKEQKIDFKYSKLKRNKNGEITRIKVTLNDNKGNKSSSTFDTGDKGINPILVGKNNNSLTIKSI